MSDVLYHFACHHSAGLIVADGHVRPVAPWPAGSGLESAKPVVWLTDLPDPEPDQVGLTSATLSCDRLAHRFTVPAKAWDWRSFAVAHGCTFDYWRDLSGVSAARPDRWFVATRPLAVLAHEQMRGAA